MTHRLLRPLPGRLPAALLFFFFFFWRALLDATPGGAGPPPAGQVFIGRGRLYYRPCRSGSASWCLRCRGARLQLLGLPAGCSHYLREVSLLTLNPRGQVLTHGAVAVCTPRAGLP